VLSCRAWVDVTWQPLPCPAARRDISVCQSDVRDFQKRGNAGCVARGAGVWVCAPGRSTGQKGYRHIASWPNKVAENRLPFTESHVW
jgi:hypothetical protein